MVCALYITLANTNGVNGHAADADEHIHRAHCHNDRADQVDCPQRVCPHAPAYKNSVNDGEQKEADIAEYCGKTYRITFRTFALYMFLTSIPRFPPIQEEADASQYRGNHVPKRISFFHMNHFDDLLPAQFRRCLLFDNFLE